MKGRPFILPILICGLLSACRTPVTEPPPAAATPAAEVPIVAATAVEAASTVAPGAEEAGPAEAASEPEDTTVVDDAPSAADGPDEAFSEYRAIDEATADDPVVTERVVQTDVSYPIGLIGAVEPIFILGSNEPFRARVDTGATTSSVDADNIQWFERDGREWVSFEIAHRKSKEVLHLDLPVKRRIAIKRQEGESEERFVVDLTVRIGGIEMNREFSLADRGAFEYSVLIGRNVLRGMAIVDVAQQNVLD